MDGGFRDWLSGLSRRELAAVGLLALVALGGATAWYLRSMPREVRFEAAPVPGPDATPAEAEPLLVHVAGWVRRPGVYELEAGDRVIDALRAAGGPRRGALLDALNLAAPLSDGQQVLVPREQPPGAPGAPGAAPGVAADGATALVNVNTADAGTLDTLPGIGEVLAAAIIDFREKNGPFTSVEELINVSGIGEVTLEELRDLVTV